MNNELKIQLQDFKKQYKNYKKYISETDWNKELDIAESYETESSIVENMMKDLKKFTKENETSLHLKSVQEFFKFCTGVVDIHIKRIDKYLKKNDWGTKYKEDKEEIVLKINALEKEGIDETNKEHYEDLKKVVSDLESEKRKEIKFQNNLFTQKTKIRVEKLNLNIDSENTTMSPKLFYGDKKAALIMKDYLYSKDAFLRERTDLLKINWESPNPATSKEMYINMKAKDIPPYDEKKHFFEQPVSTIQFWAEEVKKIKEGININGYHLSPFLYFAANYGSIPQGSGATKKVAPALLRDNEYYFDESLKNAVEKGYEAILMYGTRRFGKTGLEALYLAQGLLAITNCSANLNGFSGKDLNEVKTYLYTIFTNLPPALRPNINVNSPKEFKLGIKESAQSHYNMAKLDILNLEGTKTGGQKPAGGTPDRILFDEALNEDEYVVTEKGFNKISDVVIGDEIYDHTGKTTTVLDKIDVGEKQLYKVELRNGVSIEACGDHLWEVRDKFNKGKVFVKTTEELLKNFKVYGGRSKYSIRKTKPVDFKRKEVTIDPYFLGLFLGDGLKKEPSIVSIDDHIIDYVEKYSEKLGLRFLKKLKKDGDRKTPTYVASIRKVKGRNNILIDRFREYGIYNNKRIPKEYLFNSIDVRLEVLRGFMDTDGSINKNSVCSIVQVKKDLFEDLRILIESLGISAKCSERVIKGKVYYEAIFNTDLKVFRLPRKLKKQRESLSDKGQHNKDWVSIENIEPTRVNQAYCIKVDNKDKLFLTTMFTVTHNCAKGDILTPYLALRPALAGGEDGKPRATVIMSGTSGDSVLSKPAEKLLKNTEAYGVLPMDYDLLEKIADPEYYTWTHKKFATFVPTQMSLFIPKKKTNLKEFLKSDIDELSKIDMYETDWKKGKEFFDERRKNTKSDYKAHASEISSHPMDTDDVYLSGDKNQFDAISMKRHKSYLIDNAQTGTKTRFYLDTDGKVKTSLTNDPIVETYPFSGRSISAPALVFEKVEDGAKPPFGLYVIGIDDVKHDKTSGDSVLSLTVYKRGIELSEWSDRVVCTLATRPEKKKYAYKEFYCIMKHYNAIVFIESDDEGFKDYIETRHKTDAIIHLAESVDFSRSLGFSHNKNRPVGFSTAGNNVRRLNARVLAYTQEVLDEESGMEGHTRINDTMLLEEMINNKPDSNADRLRSFGLSLIYAEYLDKENMYISKRRYRERGDDEPRKQVKMNRGLTSGFKGMKRNPW